MTCAELRAEATAHDPLLNDWSELMKAYVVETPGGIEALQLREIPKPEPKPGWVVLKVKAFGLNRTETFIRGGKVPMGVHYPVVPGIECVGVVEHPSDSGLTKGQKVAALHPGHMGFYYDGSYAEYVLIDAACVFPVETTLDWGAFAALPELFQAVYGALTAGLDLQPGQSLLIRGGTTSLGLTAASIAHRMGCTVLSTTRNREKHALLTDSHVDHVIIDDGHIQDDVHAIYPDGVDRVLEIVGMETMADSLQCSAKGGVVCMLGQLTDKSTMDGFSVFGVIPHCVRLTAYYGAARDMVPEKFQEFLRDVESGEQVVRVSRTFTFDQVREAHQVMEDNAGNGKMVCVVDAT